MNLANLAAVVLISLAIVLVAVGGLFGTIPLVEDTGRMLGNMEEPYRGILQDSPGFTVVVMFGTFALPAVLLAAIGVALAWLGRRRLASHPPRSQRRIVVGSVAGLLLVSLGLIPLLWIVPTAVMAPVALVAKEAAGQGVPGRHPVLVFSLALMVLGSGPLSLGSGLLYLSRLDRRALKQSRPATPESSETRGRRHRWNQRLERLCLLLVCGVVLTLAINGLVLLLRVAGQYPQEGAQPFDPISIAHTPEAYWAGALLIGIPILILALWAVGLRMFLIRPDPGSSGPRPTSP